MFAHESSNQEKLYWRLTVLSRVTRASSLLNFVVQISGISLLEKLEYKRTWRVNEFIPQIALIPKVISSSFKLFLAHFRFRNFREGLELAEAWFCTVDLLRGLTLTFILYENPHVMLVGTLYLRKNQAVPCHASTTGITLTVKRIWNINSFTHHPLLLTRIYSVLCVNFLSLSFVCDRCDFSSAVQ